MANPGDLVSLDQAEAWLQEAADPGNLIAGLISSVSAQIQNFIGYQLASASYTRTFNGVGGDKMLLPDRPVTAVSAVTINTISIPAAAPPAPGFLFDSKFVYLSGYERWGRGFGGIARFERGVQNVAITYTAGYETIPYDIQQACLNWMSSAYAMLGEDPSISVLKAGDTQINHANVLTKIGDSTVIVPPAIASALMPYRRVAT